MLFPKNPWDAWLGCGLCGRNHGQGLFQLVHRERHARSVLKLKAIPVGASPGFSNKLVQQSRTFNWSGHVSLLVAKLNLSLWLFGCKLIDDMEQPMRVVLSSSLSRLLDNFLESRLANELGLRSVQPLQKLEPCSMKPNL